jgi:hypothetical protein
VPGVFVLIKNVQPGLPAGRSNYSSRVIGYISSAIPAETGVAWRKGRMEEVVSSRISKQERNDLLIVIAKKEKISENKP